MPSIDPPQPSTCVKSFSMKKNAALWIYLETLKEKTQKNVLKYNFIIFIRPSSKRAKKRSRFAKNLSQMLSAKLTLLWRKSRPFMPSKLEETQEKNQVAGIPRRKWSLTASSLRKLLSKSTCPLIKRIRMMNLSQVEMITGLTTNYPCIQMTRRMSPQGETSTNHMNLWRMSWCWRIHRDRAKRRTSIYRSSCRVASRSISTLIWVLVLMRSWMNMKNDRNNFHTVL